MDGIFYGFLSKFKFGLRFYYILMLIYSHLTRILINLELRILKGDYKKGVQNVAALDKELKVGTCDCCQVLQPSSFLTGFWWTTIIVLISCWSSVLVLNISIVRVCFILVSRGWGVLKNDFIHGFISYVLVYRSNWFIFIVASLREEKKKILTLYTTDKETHLPCHAITCQSRLTSFGNKVF